MGKVAWLRVTLRYKVFGAHSRQLSCGAATPPGIDRGTVCRGRALIVKGMRS